MSNKELYLKLKNDILDMYFGKGVVNESNEESETDGKGDSK